MDIILKELCDEAERLFHAGNYAKAEKKFRELMRLAKQRGDDARLGNAYVLLMSCLDRLKKVITMHDSREVALTLFPFLSEQRVSGCMRRGPTFSLADIRRQF
jgi:tetratricopeptide (TPR) repeat protein